MHVSRLYKFALSRDDAKSGAFHLETGSIDRINSLHQIIAWTRKVSSAPGEEFNCDAH